jgi:hypothetical protein
VSRRRSPAAAPPGLAAAIVAARFSISLSREEGVMVSASRRARVVGALSGALSGIVLGGFAFFSIRSGAPAVEMIAGREGTTLAVSGRPSLLKAVLPPRPGHALGFTWVFGDGSPAVSGTVADPHAVSASHLYPASPAGTVFAAHLTITDAVDGTRATGATEVRVVEPTLENRTTIALDDGLWALHASMIRVEDPVEGSIGYWNRETYPTGSTAMAALAFEVNGFDSRASRRSPYRETVDRALRYLVSRCRPSRIADAGPKQVVIALDDWYRLLYELPLVSMALTASQDPAAIATNGPEGIRGKTRRELVAGMIDCIAFAQNRESSWRGGWRYMPRGECSDTSVTQWPVLACMSAREVFGIETPASIAGELAGPFLGHVQGADGGFGYLTATDRPSVRLTGAGLIALRFAGVPASDERVVRATSYVAKHWETENVGDSYAMYTIMKAAKLSGEAIETFGVHDWRQEYGERLCRIQNADGSWPARSGNDVGALATCWPTLTLSKDVFFTARPLTPGGLLPVLVLPPIGLLALLAFRRRAR